LAADAPDSVNDGAGRRCTRAPQHRAAGGEASISVGGRSGREAAEYLAADPYEHNNLSSDPTYAALMGREKLHLQAWMSFQNP
jgi:hypothetical protein